MTERVATFPRRTIAGGRRACVAIALVPQEDGMGLLLTSRARGMRTHARQFALPGGMAEEGETAEQTVLREVEEELGIGAEAWRVVDVLDDFPLGSSMVMTPLVLVATEPPDLDPNPDEVDRVSVISLPRDRVELEWVPAVEQPFGAANAVPALALRLGGDLDLYAPTGAIVKQFISWWFDRVVCRVAAVAPPVFVHENTSAERTLND